MHPDIQKLLSDLFDRIQGRTKKAKSAALFVKVGLVALGSACVAVAQFMQFGPTGPTGWQIAGILSAIVVAIGAVFVVLTEEDAPAEMNLAYKALEAAREVQESYSQIIKSQMQLEMAISIYTLMKLMRDVIERSVPLTLPDVELVKLMFDVAKRNMPIALGFEQSDQWTICAYRAVSQATGRTKLICIAQNRAVECELGEAREWEEGVGVAGIAYANKIDVIVPDMLSADIGTMFNIGGRQRSYDTTRYRSIVAVPIHVDKEEHPWGIVTATSDRPFFFAPEEESGIKSTEGVRAIAAMIALVVSISAVKNARQRELNAPDSLSEI